MLRKDVIARGGKLLAADIADLVAVVIGVCISSIGAQVLAAVCATCGAILSKLVLNAVKSDAAVFAARRAAEVANVAGIGICLAAIVAGFVTCLIICVRNAGGLAADIAGLASESRGGGVFAGRSLFAAFVALGVAIAVIGVSRGLALDHESLAAVAANGAASSLGLVCFCIALTLADLSVAGGASVNIAIGVASGAVSVSRDGLAANGAETVAIKGLVVDALVVADALASIADEVAVLVGVLDGLGGAAVSAAQIVAKTLPNALILSLVSATVVADQVAGIGICVEVTNSGEAATVAGQAASELVVVRACGNGSGFAAIGAGNGAGECIAMRGLAGCAAVGADAGAGMKVCMGKLCTNLAANITGSIAGIAVSVNHSRSDSTANGAGRGASLCVSVLQLGAGKSASIAAGVAIARIGVLDRFDLGETNGAFRAVAGFTRVLNRNFSLHRRGAAVAERIAIGRVLVVNGTEAGCEREERESHSQK